MIGEKNIWDSGKKEIKPENSRQKKNKNVYVFLGLFVIVMLVVFLIPKQKSEESQTKTISPIEYVQKLSDHLDSNDVEVKYLQGNSDVPNRYLIIQDGYRFLTVEFYQSNTLAQKRADNLISINNMIDEVDSSNDFPRVLDLIGARYFKSRSLVIDNVVFYYSQLEENISSKIKQVVNENKKNILKQDETYNSIIGTFSKDLFQKNVSDCVNNLDKQIEMILVQNLDLKKEDINDFKESIAPFASVKSVESLYKKWKKYYDLIAEGKFKGSEEVENILKRISKIVYEPGEYTVGVDVLEGYYICVADNQESNAYFNKMEWRQNVIAYLKKGEKVKLNKGQKIYSLANSPELKVTGKTSGVFKVGQHIKAGTYTLSAPSNSPTNYWIIDGDNPDKLLSLSQSTIFKSYTGCKEISANQSEKITLKDGQLLYLLDGMLER